MIRWTFRRHDTLARHTEPDQTLTTEIEESFVEDYKKNMGTKFGPELAIVQAAVENMVFAAERERNKK